MARETTRGAHRRGALAIFGVAMGVVLTDCVWARQPLGGTLGVPTGAGVAIHVGAVPPRSVGMDPTLPSFFGPYSPTPGAAIPAGLLRGTVISVAPAYGAPRLATAGTIVAPLLDMHDPSAGLPVSPLVRPEVSGSAVGPAASADDAPLRLAATFDGSAPRGRLGGREAVRARFPAGGLGEVRRLSWPFKTRRQLERLERVPRAEAEPFRFAVVGDAEPGRFRLWRFLFGRPGVFDRALHRLAGETVDFVVQLGDMVSTGTSGRFVSFLRRLTAASLPMPYLTVLGNHDRRRPHGRTDSVVYRAAFGPADYWFERGGVRFVVVDSSLGGLSPRQLSWLAAALSTTKLKVIFTHMAPAAIGAWTDAGPLRGVGGFREGAEEFIDLVSQSGVSRVYSGHVHGLDSVQRGGVRYVLTGGGGSPLFPSGAREKFYHYLVVDAGPDGFADSVRRLDSGEGPP